MLGETDSRWRVETEIVLDCQHCQDVVLKQNFKNDSPCSIHTIGMLEEIAQVVKNVFDGQNLFLAIAMIRDHFD